MQVWAHFMQPEALPYDFVLSRTRESLWAGFLQKNEAEIPEEEKLYRALAHQINLSPSEYTDLIAEFIAKGYVDLSTVDRTTKRLSLKVSQQRAHTELGAVWHTYTDSFGDDESEIRAEFLRILDLHADKINISEYSAALDMLSTFDVDVNFLVEKYVTLHADELSAYNPSDPLLSRRVSFDPLRKKVNELISRRSNLTIDEVTLRISVNKGWNKEDIEYLASLSEEQIREWMLSKPSDMAGKIQGGLLFFSNLSGSSDEDNARYKQISDITIGALRSIASTSSLNKRRVSSVYSISLDS